MEGAIERGGAIASEDAQFTPAMYIYNLSRSQWANQLNMEWIYIDAARRNEAAFVLLVNSIPEEQNDSYMDTMERVTDELRVRINERNNNPINATLPQIQGTVQVLTNLQALRRTLQSHEGDKRLMFAGGSKRFYRDLAHIESAEVVFSQCEIESDRRTSVAEELGEGVDDYVQQYYDKIGTHFEQARGATPNWNNTFQLGEASISRKLQLTHTQSYGGSPTTTISRHSSAISDALNARVEMLGDHGMDVRIDATVEALLEIPNLENLNLRKSVRDRIKSIQSLRIVCPSGSTEHDERHPSEPNDESYVLQCSRGQNEQTILYDFQFDSRAIERSVFQILTLLESGHVRLHFPNPYSARIENWFNLCTDTMANMDTSQNVTILDNRNGDEISELFPMQLRSSRLCSELQQQLEPSTVLRLLVISLMFTQTRVSQPGLQEWAIAQMPPASVGTEPFRLEPLPNRPDSNQSRRWEGFVNSSLSCIQQFEIQSFINLDVEQFMRSIPNLQSNQRLTCDDACYFVGPNGVPQFWAIDSTVGVGINSKKKIKEKLHKYKSVNFGKDFFSNTLLTILTNSNQNSEDIIRPFIHSDHAHKKFLIVKAPQNGHPSHDFSPQELAEILANFLLTDSDTVACVYDRNSTPQVTYFTAEQIRPQGD